MLPRQIPYFINTSIRYPGKSYYFQSKTNNFINTQFFTNLWVSAMQMQAYYLYVMNFNWQETQNKFTNCILALSNYLSKSGKKTNLYKYFTQTFTSCTPFLHFITNNLNLINIIFIFT